MGDLNRFKLFRSVRHHCVFVVLFCLEQSIVMAQVPSTLVLPLRPINERSKVDRYRNDRDYERDHLDTDQSRVSRPRLFISEPLNQNGEGSPLIRQAQFQFPAPGNRSAGGGDFLNPSGDSPKLESLGETGFDLSPVAENSGSPSSSDRSIDSGLSDNRELPRTNNMTGASNSDNGLPARNGQSEREYVQFSQREAGEPFATMNNSSFVSPASGYSATTSWGRNCVTSNTGFPTDMANIKGQGTPSGLIDSGGLVKILPSSELAKYKAVPTQPLLQFGQDQNGVVVGHGLLGQPVAYVPGQWVRNSIRYLFP